MLLALLEGFGKLIVNAYWGVLSWKAGNIPFWGAFLFLLVHGSIATLFFFYGTGWLKRHVGWLKRHVDWLKKHLGKRAVFRRVSSIIARIRSIKLIQILSHNIRRLKHIIQRLLRRRFSAWLVTVLVKGTDWFVLGLGFVPISALPKVVVISARLMEIKYALPILLVGNAVRSFLLCWAFYRDLT